MRDRRTPAIASAALWVACLPTMLLADAATGLTPGDRMPAFPVTALTGPYAGKTVMYVSETKGAPTLIVFVKDAGEYAQKVLAKADELTRRYTPKGLKGFAVCLGGPAVGAELQALAKKHNWILPLTVTRGGLTDPAVKLCKLDPKAPDTIVLSAKHLVTYARQAVAPEKFGGVAKAIEGLAK